MKKIALCVTIMLFSAAAFSQHHGGIELGWGLDVGVPVGGFGLKTNPGIGGDARLGYNFNEKWALLAQAGYIAFFTTDKLREQNIGTIGDGFIKFCGRYTTNNRLYFEPQLGFSKFSSGNSSKVSGNGFTYAAAVGYYADAAKTFDFSIRYESTTNAESIRFVALRIGYRLPPGRFL